MAYGYRRRHPVHPPIEYVTHSACDTSFTYDPTTRTVLLFENTDAIPALLAAGIIRKMISGPPAVPALQMIHYEVCS